MLNDNKQKSLTHSLIIFTLVYFCWCKRGGGGFSHRQPRFESFISSYTCDLHTNKNQRKLRCVHI